MLQEQRLQKIIDRLRAEGRVLSTELAGLLNVSEDTVRRDLAELGNRGLLRRVHGGAVPISTTPLDFRVRSREHVSEKHRIAETAATMIGPGGQLIFLDAGTTVLELARQMPRDYRGTVITHCTSTATALADFPDLEVFLIGGKLLKHSLTAVGAETVAAYERIHADLCFLGVCSIHAEFGVTDLTMEESSVKRAMIRQAARTVVLATGDKLGVAANFQVAPVAEIDQVITDGTASRKAIEELRAVGVTVEVVR